MFNQLFLPRYIEGGGAGMVGATNHCSKEIGETYHVPSSTVTITLNGWDGKA